MSDAGRAGLGTPTRLNTIEETRREGGSVMPAEAGGPRDGSPPRPGVPAAVAMPTTLASAREDREAVQAMVAHAEARGWRGVELSGTPNFRREAWVEATARGVSARGHEPTDYDRAEAEARRAGRDAPSPDLPREDSRPRETPDVSRRPDAEVALQAARAGLSPDGRLVLAALDAKIERGADRLDAGAKAELKAFAASELLRREHAEGPIVLSAAQRRAAEAPEPSRDPPPALRRVEPDPPRLSPGR